MVISSAVCPGQDGPPWPFLPIAEDVSLSQLGYDDIIGLSAQRSWRTSVQISTVFSPKCLLWVSTLSTQRSGTLQSPISAFWAPHPCSWQVYISQFSSGLARTKRWKESRFGSIDLELIPGPKLRVLIEWPGFQNAEGNCHRTGESEWWGVEGRTLRK